MVFRRLVALNSVPSRRSPFPLGLPSFFAAAMFSLCLSQRNINSTLAANTPAIAGKKRRTGSVLRNYPISAFISPSPSHNGSSFSMTMWIFSKLRIYPPMFPNYSYLLLGFILEASNAVSDPPLLANSVFLSVKFQQLWQWLQFWFPLDLPFPSEIKGQMNSSLTR